MDISTLKKHIEDSTVSPELKQQVMGIIEQEGVYSEALVAKIQNVLSGSAEDLIEQIANLQIQDALDTFNEESDELEKEIDQFNADIDTKIAEVEAQTQ